MVDPTLPPVPTTFEESQTIDGGKWATIWQASRAKEVDALTRQNTHQEPNSTKPTGKVVSTKWAFRITRTNDGSLKFKMRLVAKGYMQRRGVDYFETFAPVCSAKAITTILSIAASEDYELRSYDVGAAYLEAPILAVSGLNWNREIHQHLVRYGFIRSISDPCV